MCVLWRSASFLLITASYRLYLCGLKLQHFVIWSEQECEITTSRLFKYGKSSLSTPLLFKVAMKGWEKYQIWR